MNLLLACLASVLAALLFFAGTVMPNGLLFGLCALSGLAWVVFAARAIPKMVGREQPLEFGFAAPFVCLGVYALVMMFMGGHLLAVIFWLIISVLVFFISRYFRLSSSRSIFGELREGFESLRSARQEPAKKPASTGISRAQGAQREVLKALMRHKGPCLIGIRRTQGAWVVVVQAPKDAILPEIPKEVSGIRVVREDSPA